MNPLQTPLSHISLFGLWIKKLNGRYETIVNKGARGIAKSRYEVSIKMRRYERPDFMREYGYRSLWLGVDF